MGTIWYKSKNFKLLVVSLNGLKSIQTHVEIASHCSRQREKWGGNICLSLLEKKLYRFTFSHPPPSALKTAKNRGGRFLKIRYNFVVFRDKEKSSGGSLKVIALMIGQEPFFHTSCFVRDIAIFQHFLNRHTSFQMPPIILL